MSVRGLILASLFLSACAATDTDGDGVIDGEDCAPEDPEIYPGAAEACDGIDRDCDLHYWGGGPRWRDQDSDGYGDPAVPAEACGEVGWVANMEDCDDDRAEVHPGAAEICDDLDNDCDGLRGAREIDGDADGWTPCDGDCDDATAVLFPDSPPICDGVACPGATWEVDLDGDGGFACDFDYNEEDPGIYGGAADGPPGAVNGIDDDCNGLADVPVGRNRAWATIIGDSNESGSSHPRCGRHTTSLSRPRGRNGRRGPAVTAMDSTTGSLGIFRRSPPSGASGSAIP